MKKFLLFLAATLLAVSMPVTVFAHCGGGGYGRHHGGTAWQSSYQAAPTYSACGIDDCALIGPHQHGESWYSNHSGINWGLYGACAVDGCLVNGMHAHDGSWYHCWNYSTPQ